jgi:hypothetical protein
MAEEH